MQLKNLFASDNSFSGSSSEEEFCCGKHEICEKSRVIQTFKKTVEYYDDEELDVFKNRSGDSYSDEEVEQFAEIFHTMWKSDLPGWLSSLRARNIQPPNQLGIRN
jgi:hypothetical protein